MGKGDMMAEQIMASADRTERSDRCEPAYGIIQRLGGYEQVALYVRTYGINQARAMNRSAVYRWTMLKENGGTAGIIPAKHWPALIKAAREARGITLYVSDFSPLLAAAIAGASP